MRTIVVFAVATLASLHAEPMGDACSCIIDRPVISPGDGVTGVPRNALVIVEYGGASLDPQLELRDATTNAVIPLTLDIRLGGATVFGKPTTPLAANTTYVITATDATSMRTSTFTTGDATDNTPPSFEGLHGIVPISFPYTEPGASAHCVAVSHGQISGTLLDYEPVPEDVVHVALEIRDRKGDLVDEVTVPTSSPDTLGFNLCGPQSPQYVDGGDYCARLVAYDIAGNRAGDSMEVCAIARNCMPDPLHPTNTCRLPGGGCSTSGAPPRWLALAGLTLATRRRRAR